MNIGYHCDLIREAFMFSSSVFHQDHPAVRVAQLSNFYTDIFQRSEICLIDPTRFTDSLREIVECLHTENLPQEEDIVKYVKSLTYVTTKTLEAITSNSANTDLKAVIMIIGSTLHIIHDFYAHTNWSELYIDALDGVIADACYFEVGQDKINRAVEKYNNLGVQRYVYGNERDFFACCHKEKRPSHTRMHKDYAGRAFFERAYKSAFRASVIWLEYIKTIVGDHVWRGIEEYNGGSKWSKIKKITEPGTGTLFKLFSYAGAWKAPSSQYDALTSTALIKEALSLLSDFFDASLLNKWKNSVCGISKWLFERSNAGKLVYLKQWGIKKNGKNFLDEAKRIHERDGYENYIKSLNPKGLVNNLVNFFQSVETDGYLKYLLKKAFNDENTFDEFKRLFEEKLEANISRINSDQKFNSQYERLKGIDINKEYGWFKIRIPECKNSDSTCGDSDIYTRIFINGTLYREAEYLDNDNPKPCWMALKPILKNQLTRDIDIKVQFKEDDEYTANDVYGVVKGKFNPYYNTFNCNEPVYTHPTGVKVLFERSGFKGILQMGMMSKNTLEIGAIIPDVKWAGTDHRIFADIGPMVYLLDNPENDDFERMTSNIFSFDPGKEIEKDYITRLLLYKGNDSDKNGGVLIEKAYVVFNGELITKGKVNKWLGKNVNRATISSNIKEERIVDLQEENKLKTIGIKLETEYNFKDGDGNGTDDIITVSFLDDRNNIVLSYELFKKHLIDDYYRDKFENGNLDFFYMETVGSQKDVKLKNISRVEIKRKYNGKKYGKWGLKHVEVWLNNKKAFDHYIDIKTLKDNRKWISPERKVSKGIYFKNIPSVISTGINEVERDVYYHTYEFTIDVGRYGFTSSPRYEWNIYGAYGSYVSADVIQMGSKARIRIYYNKNNANARKYIVNLKVSESRRQEVFHKTININIPCTGASINEERFAEEEVILNGKKAIQFVGDYTLKYYGFGDKSEEDLCIQWYGDGAEIHVEEENKSMPKIVFKTPPNKYEYIIRAQVKDKWDVHETYETSMKIIIPKLVPIIDYELFTPSLDYNLIGKKHQKLDQGLKKEKRINKNQYSNKEKEISLIKDLSFENILLSYADKVTVELSSVKIYRGNERCCGRLYEPYRMKWQLSNLEGIKVASGEINSGEYGERDKDIALAVKTKKSKKGKEKLIFTYNFKNRPENFYKLKIILIDSIGREGIYEETIGKIRNSIFLYKEFFRETIYYFKENCPMIFDKDFINNIITNPTTGIAFKVISGMGRDRREYIKDLLEIRKIIQRERVEGFNMESAAIANDKAVKIMEYMIKDKKVTSDLRKVSLEIKKSSIKKPVSKKPMKKLNKRYFNKL